MGDLIELLKMLGFMTAIILFVGFVFYFIPKIAE